MVEPAGMPDTVMLVLVVVPVTLQVLLPPLAKLLEVRRVPPVVTKLMLPAKLLKRLMVVPAWAAGGSRAHASKAAAGASPLIQPATWERILFMSLMAYLYGPVRSTTKPGLVSKDPGTPRSIRRT